MIKRIKHLLVTLFLAAFLAACASSTLSPAGGPGVADPLSPALNRDAAYGYADQFQIQFSGASSWTYQLSTRRSPVLREINLHMDGLSKAQNPGDIRMVTDGAQSWMIGDGTGGECIQFPNKQGMDPSFLYPESLVSLQQVGDALQLVGEEDGPDLYSGAKITLLHFRAAGVATGPWKDAAFEIWQEKDTGMLRRFTFQAEGDDPFFEAGEGRLAASYQTAPLGDQPIAHIAGCEISVQLPDSAAGFVRLPGMASFESPQSVQEIQQFYQSRLPQENWAETAAATEIEGATVLSYSRGAEEVQIAIEPRDSGGVLVKLLFSQGQ